MATLLSSIETEARRHLKELPALSDPGAPTVTPTGTTGATAYSYKVVAMHRHGTTAASSAGSTATGNATLSSTNFNRVTWTAVTGAESYVVYRSASSGTPSSVGVVGVVGAVTTFDDTGIAGDATTAPTANTSGGAFWTSAELVAIANKGMKDLWGAIIDLYGEHFLTVDVTNVSQAANATTLTGVPTDVFRVYLIEPRDTTAGANGEYILFKPRAYNSDEFINARMLTAQSVAAGLTVFYNVSGAGAPVGAPTIHVAPILATAVNLRFAYVPTIPDKAASDANPIPGESDNALIAWIVAYAMAKGREDKSPDPNWLAVYSTEKQNVLVRSAPRQQQEDQFVDDFFGSYM